MTEIQYPIHIAFCVNDPYVQYILVTIKSIIENHKSQDIHFHVFSDEISHENHKRLEKVCEKHQCSIYILDDKILRGLKTGRYTKYTWYRVLIPEIIGSDIHRILYLDADTLVLGKLSSLFSIDMTNKSIAASPDDWNHIKGDKHESLSDIRTNTYFCAGVLLMNLDHWRENKISEKVIEWAKENNEKLEFPDQDALNYICRDSKILLTRNYDITFNQFYDDYFFNERFSEYRESLLNPKIVHFCAQLPWQYDGRHPFIFMWHKYNSMLRNNKAKVGYKSGHNIVLKLKTYLWHKLHPNFFKGLYEAEILKLQGSLI